MNIRTQWPTRGLAAICACLMMATPSLAAAGGGPHGQERPHHRMVPAPVSKTEQAGGPSNGPALTRGEIQRLVAQAQQEAAGRRNAAEHPARRNAQRDAQRDRKHDQRKHTDRDAPHSRKEDRLRDRARDGTCDAPSDDPADNPSDTPTDDPTDTPTDEPSLTPAAQTAWVLGQQDGNELLTGFVRSFADGGTAVTDSLTRIAYTYDQAAVAMGLLALGDAQAARTMLNQAADLLSPDGSLAFAYHVDSGEALGAQRTGTLAWMAYAMLTYEAQTGETIAGAQGQTEPAWARLLDAMIASSWDDTRGAFTGGPDVTWISTEHNLRVMRVLDLARDAATSAPAATAAVSEAQYARYLDIADRLEQTLLSPHMFNGEFFMMGYDDPSLVTDVQLLGAGWLLSRGDQPGALALWEATGRTFGLTQTLETGEDLWGLPWSPAADGVSTEVTLQYARLAGLLGRADDAASVLAGMDALTFADGAVPQAHDTFMDPLVEQESHTWKHVVPTVLSAAVRQALTGSANDINE